MVTAVFFGVAASSDWATGFMWSYVVIAGLIGLALLLAVYDLRAAKRGTWRATHPRIDE